MNVTKLVLSAFTGLAIAMVVNVVPVAVACDDGCTEVDWWYNNGSEYGIPDPNPQGNNHKYCLIFGDAIARTGRVQNDDGDQSAPFGATSVTVCPDGHCDLKCNFIDDGWIESDLGTMPDEECLEIEDEADKANCDPEGE